MCDASEQALYFLTNLSHKEKEQLLEALTDILTTYEKDTDKKISSQPLFENRLPLYDHFLRFHLLLQFKNLHNEELVIREVQENFLFKNRYFLQVFYNCQEIPFEFVKKIYLLLEEETTHLLSKKSGSTN